MRNKNSLTRLYLSTVPEDSVRYTLFAHPNGQYEYTAVHRHNNGLRSLCQAQ